MKMMERKAYTAFGETGFGETGRHRVGFSPYPRVYFAVAAHCGSRSWDLSHFTTAVRYVTTATCCKTHCIW